MHATFYAQTIKHRRSLFPLAAAALWAAVTVNIVPATAQAADPAADKTDGVWQLWPTGVPAEPEAFEKQRAQVSQRPRTAERIAYVEDPTLVLYQADPKRHNGCGLIVCPGGGYNILAWEKEGVEIAKYFNTLGVTCLVLKYRVPRRDPDRPHEAPLQDAQRAIRLVRQKADELHVDPARIGILGFSAGGNLAVMAGTRWQQTTYPPVDAADQLSCRPDYVVPIYAAYLGDPENPFQLGPQVIVNKQTPPMFLAVTQDDKQRGVHAALLFARLSQVGVPAEVHVYTNGGHGYGIRPSGNPVETWHVRCGEWLRSRNLLEKSDS